LFVLLFVWVFHWLFVWLAVGRLVVCIVDNLIAYVTKQCRRAICSNPHISPSFPLIVVSISGFHCFCYFSLQLSFPMQG
jgi:hypothetical protein